MQRTISLSLPHDLGEEEVKRRLVKGIADLRTRHPNYLRNAQETWNGNTMEFRAAALGQTMTGRVQVEARQVHIHVDLPLVLAMLASKLRPQIEAEGRKMLEAPQ